MTKKKIRQIIREEIDNMLREIEKLGWDKLPAGWDEESLEEYVKSLIGFTKADIKKDSEGKPDIKDFFTKCVDKVKDSPRITDPDAFCASLKDAFLGTAAWRGSKTL